jgi:transposase
MNNPKALKIVIALLVVALFTSFGFLAYAIHQSHEWKYVVWLQDGRIAAYRALGDFSRNHAVGISSGERNLAARPLIEMFLSLICRHQTVGKTDCNAIGFCSVTGCHFICCVVYFGQFTGSTAWFRLRPNPSGRFGSFRELRKVLEPIWEETTGRKFEKPQLGKQTAGFWHNKGASFAALEQSMEAIGCYDKALAI